MQNNINSPIDFCKKNIDDLFNERKTILDVMTYMNEQTFYDVKMNDYHIPTTNMFFHQIWNKTFLIKVDRKKFVFKLVANFIVIDVMECIHYYNDKSKKLPNKYYLISIKNADGNIEKNVKVAYNSKSDLRQFQSEIDSFYNNFFINMQEAEFKSFVSEYISPKVASTLNIYSNPGLLENRNVLYENALATPEGIIWADNDGCIKIDEKSYIRVEEGSHHLPKLVKSTKSGQQISTELMNNIKECWADNILLPLLTLGSMVMSIYYNDFIKNYGVPTLILYGETGTGKSTIITVGLAIFGLSKDAMTSGGSTAKSNEFLCSKYNCMNICIDDVKAETLTSSNFTSLIKGVYNGLPRTKMLPYGKGVEYVYTCSPLSYSTNETLPELREVINRINIIEMFGKTFKSELFKYHETSFKNNNNLKELSLILPEILKFPVENVFEVYNKIMSNLLNSVGETQGRILSNIAYAFTGALLLINISGVEFDNIMELIVEYTKKQVKRYEDIQTPVEKVLSSIATLYELKYLEYGTNFKIVAQKNEYQIRFNKKAVISAINKFYAHDKNNQINETAFNNYAANSSRYRGYITVRFNNQEKPTNSMCFNITDLADYKKIIDEEVGNIL